MRVLWITNILFPDVCKEMGISEPVIGGWMYSSAKELLKRSNIELAVATIYPGKKLLKYKINGILYYVLPSRTKGLRYEDSLEIKWSSIVNEFHPDIAHIHGTEYAHGLAFLKACPEVKAVISIQGLLSVCERYYLSGISYMNCIRNITIRDIIKFDSIPHAKYNFKRRGEMEKTMVKSVKYVIGRTSWDEVHVKAFNPEVKYYKCNETLREEFYKYTWSYEHCDKHSIFTSQANYPIKGLHMLLKAMPFVLEKFPDSILYIGGTDITDSSSLKKIIKRTSYARYIIKLIKKSNLKAHVKFLGPLDEFEMCRRYLKSNVFVCPSSIENSPNSLGEAQILGVPCITSFAGGIPDMMRGAEMWLYRFEEVEMLAEKICQIFAGAKFPNALLQSQAMSRHDSQKNIADLINIYHDIR